MEQNLWTCVCKDEWFMVSEFVTNVLIVYTRSVKLWTHIMLLK